MRKTLLVVICLVSLKSFSQKRSSQFSIASEGAVMATEQAFTVYNPGFGGSAKFMMPIGKKDFVTLNFSVMNFSGRAGTAKEMFKQILGTSAYNNLVNSPLFGQPFDSIMENTNLSHPPLTIFTPKIGYKHFLNDKINVEVEAGYCFATVKKLMNTIEGNVGGYDFSFGIGTKVGKKLDIGLRYEQFQSTASQRDFTSFVALRTLVNLDFK